MYVPVYNATHCIDVVYDADTFRTNQLIGILQANIDHVEEFEGMTISYVSGERVIGARGEEAFIRLERRKYCGRPNKYTKGWKHQSKRRHQYRS